MTQTTRLGLMLLPAALLIGLLGDALLRATPWGLNILLWVGALLGVFWLLARRQQMWPTGEGIWLGIPALLLAGGLAWRDSGTLRAIDVCGLVCCLGFGAARTRAGQVRLAGFFEYFGGIFRSAFLTVLGIFPLLFRDITWDTVPRTGLLPKVLAVGRGLILVLPLLLLFGGLLTAADPIYQKLVGTWLHFDINALLGHLCMTAFFACLAAGFGRMLFIVETPIADPEQQRAKLPSLGVLETGTILGLLNLLFLSFVLVQIRYFFGGAATVSATAGLTYTQYARTGFFELAWVSALVLPCLLGLHRLQVPSNARAQTLFSSQAAVQVGLLSVILASAVMRMRLYQQTCGLTELRLYTMAFMGWLAVIFVWFVLTVLRGRRDRFAFGAVVAAFGLVLGLHILNPDAFIVRSNAARAVQTHVFDGEYAAALSGDAVPPLIAALPTLPVAAQQQIAAALLPAWSQDTSDWRSWNWGRMSAFYAVQSRQKLLQSSLPPPVVAAPAAQTTTTLVSRKAGP
ncbi:MAG: DUF4153 domain-containing protein [Janthinobacterium lividum]